MIPPRRLTALALLALSTAATAHAQSAQEAWSAYSTLDLNGCKVLEQYEQGAVLRCDGHNGERLFISEGDLRFDVDLRAQNEQFFTISPFNSLGETVEWRYGPGDEGLRAIIVRYYYYNGGPEPYASELAVITPPSEFRESCYVALVPGNARPSQNEVARQIADVANYVSCIER